MKLTNVKEWQETLVWWGSFRNTIQICITYASSSYFSFSTNTQIGRGLHANRETYSGLNNEEIIKIVGQLAPPMQPNIENKVKF